MTRVARIGGGLAVIYVAVVIATGLVSDRSVRPLFDAIGPPPAYRWVKPPPDFAPGNIRPKSNEITFGLKPEDLPPAGSSEDSQFVFNLAKESTPAHDTDTGGVARIVPTDPDTLGPLPAKQFADGNAYQITFGYRPSGAPVTLAAPGSVLMTVPVPAEGIFFSADGRSWAPVKSQHASATAIGGELPSSGYYVAYSPEALSAPGGGGRGLVLPIALTAFVAAVLVLTPRFIRRRQRQPVTRQARRQASRSTRR